MGLRLFLAEEVTGDQSIIFKFFDSANVHYMKYQINLCICVYALFAEQLYVYSKILSTVRGILSTPGRLFCFLFFYGQIN